LSGVFFFAWFFFFFWEVLISFLAFFFSHSQVLTARRLDRLEKLKHELEQLNVKV
jgi:hypothetical protein